MCRWHYPTHRDHNMTVGGPSLGGSSEGAPRDSRDQRVPGLAGEVPAGRLRWPGLASMAMGAEGLDSEGAWQRHAKLASRAGISGACLADLPARPGTLHALLLISRSS